MVARFDLDSVSLAQKPKSAGEKGQTLSYYKVLRRTWGNSLILTFPRPSRRTLSLLMSRWMMSWLWR